MSEIEKLFGTDASLTLILGTAFVTVFLLAMMILSTGERRQRRSLTSRILGREKDQQAKETTWMPAGLAQAGERRAGQAGVVSQ